MGGLFGGVGRVSAALAVFAKLLLAVLVVLIVADVIIRNLGLRPIPWAVSAAEYSLVYIGFLTMPALVRGKGHVFVEFFRTALPAPARRGLEKAVYIICIGLSVYLGWVATDSLVSAYREGAYETRTFDMPKWLVFLPIALGFWLSAVEWLRFLWGEDSLYNIDVREMEGF